MEVKVMTDDAQKNALSDGSYEPKAANMKFRKEGHIGWMTFDKPERLNAVSDDMVLRGLEILEDFENDSQIRVIVLRNAGVGPMSLHHKSSRAASLRTPRGHYRSTSIRNPSPGDGGSYALLIAKDAKLHSLWEPAPASDESIRTAIPMPSRAYPMVVGSIPDRHFRRSASRVD